MTIDQYMPLLTILSFISYCIVVLCGKKNNNNNIIVIMLLGTQGDLCVTKGKRWFKPAWG